MREGAQHSLFTGFSGSSWNHVTPANIIELLANISHEILPKSLDCRYGKGKSRVSGFLCRRNFIPYQRRHKFRAEREILFDDRSYTLIVSHGVGGTTVSIGTKKGATKK